MIDRDHKLPLARQAKAVGISRGSIYYRPRPVGEAGLGLMRRMGIEALYRKPNTSRRRPGHTVYPYLLRGLEVSRPNQVWAMDITYIPMARGFVYLAAVMDWHSRKVLAWRVIGHNGHRLLRGGARRIPGTPRRAGDIQHRSGKPVHK